MDELERQLEANEKKARRDRLSLLRIHEDLAALGYEGGYDAVRRYARVWRRRHRLLSSSEAYVPLIFDPGEAYQFDWSHEYAVLSGTTTRVKAAHMRLCYSRMQLVQIFPRESQEMVFEAHERAFRFFGGVCRRGIYDNMKTGVDDCLVGGQVVGHRRTGRIPSRTGGQIPVQLAGIDPIVDRPTIHPEPPRQLRLRDAPVQIVLQQHPDLPFVHPRTDPVLLAKPTERPDTPSATSPK